MAVVDFMGEQGLRFNGTFLRRVAGTPQLAKLRSCDTLVNTDDWGEFRLKVGGTPQQLVWFDKLMHEGEPPPVIVLCKPGSEFPCWPKTETESDPGRLDAEWATRVDLAGGPPAPVLGLTERYAIRFLEEGLALQVGDTTVASVRTGAFPETTLTVHSNRGTVRVFAGDDLTNPVLEYNDAGWEVPDHAVLSFSVDDAYAGNIPRRYTGSILSYIALNLSGVAPNTLDELSEMRVEAIEPDKGEVFWAS